MASSPTETIRDYSKFKPTTADEVLEKLEYLLHTSTTKYRQENAVVRTTSKQKRHSDGGNLPNRRHSNIGTRMDEQTEDKQLIQVDTAPDDEVITHQPPNLNGELRDYQIEGLRWMVNLHNNGINGILADEMGLGKSVQTISLLAYLREYRGINGKHLIVVPKSIISHWTKEFNTFYPYFKVIQLIGDKEQRAVIIKEEIPYADVILVTYEMCLIEFNALSKIQFQYVILDEAHRIKNDQGKTSLALKRLKSHHRLLLTGTPLQNNMRELWSLLNFLRPDLFSDSSEFELLYTPPSDTNNSNAISQHEQHGANNNNTEQQQDGEDGDQSPMGMSDDDDFSVLKEEEDVSIKPEEHDEDSSTDTLDNNQESNNTTKHRNQGPEDTLTPSTQPISVEQQAEKEQDKILSRLHKILRPFILRRLKKDAAKNLPPKVETKLYVKLTKLQREQYRSLLSRDIDCLNTTSANSERTRMLNIVMQLRKCCNHPYLFDGVEPEPFENGDHLIEASGKLRLLDKLLPKLKREGSRVLIFSQMTRLLDILEDYCGYRDYEYCRIDGNTPHHDREDQIDAFNAKGSKIFIFLLSTRAGGLGINLQTADTVILYDSDWNPQMDLQAMDRAHRIGQKKQVNVFRLVMEGTVEEKIVERALKKLALDALIVQKGRQLNRKDNQLKGNEIQEMIRFGANFVFQSTSDDITDEDIDLILENGRKRTEADNAKIKEALVNIDKFSLSDTTSSDFNVQTFEGEKLEIRKNNTYFHIEPPSRLAAQKAAKKIAMQRAPTLSIPKARPYRPLTTRGEWQLYDDLQRIEQLERKQWDAMERARIQRATDIKDERAKKQQFRTKLDFLERKRTKRLNRLASAAATTTTNGNTTDSSVQNENSNDNNNDDEDTHDDEDTMSDTSDPSKSQSKAELPKDYDEVKEEMEKDPEFAEYVKEVEQRRTQRAQEAQLLASKTKQERDEYLEEKSRRTREKNELEHLELIKQLGGLTSSEQQELDRLYATGFPTWRKGEVMSLLEGVAFLGHDHLDLVHQQYLPEKTLDEVKAYSRKFFLRWTTFREYKRYLSHFNQKQNQFKRTQLLRQILFDKLYKATIDDDNDNTDQTKGSKPTTGSKGKNDTTQQQQINLTKLRFNKIEIKYPPPTPLQQYGKQWSPFEDQILCVLLYYCGFPQFTTANTRNPFINAIRDQDDQPTSFLQPPKQQQKGVQNKDGINYYQLLYVLKSIPQMATNTSIQAMTKEELEERCNFLLSSFEKEHKSKKVTTAPSSSSSSIAEGDTPSAGKDGSGGQKKRGKKAAETPDGGADGDNNTQTKPKAKRGSKSTGATSKNATATTGSKKAGVPTNTELGIPEVTNEMTKEERDEIAKLRRNALSRIARQRRAEEKKKAEQGQTNDADDTATDKN